MSTNGLASQGWSDNEERIGWAIVTGLHSNVPADKRPKAWMELSEGQLGRIKAAVDEVIKILP